MTELENPLLKVFNHSLDFLQMTPKLSDERGREREREKKKERERERKKGKEREREREGDRERKWEEEGMMRREEINDVVVVVDTIWIIYIIYFFDVKCNKI